MSFVNPMLKDKKYQNDKNYQYIKQKNKNGQIFDLIGLVKGRRKTHIRSIQ